MTKKHFPIGYTDYKRLIDNNCYYVDKTLLIKEVLASPKVVSIARPAQFGKTLSLSMLRYFFEKTDESTHYLFENTTIWRDNTYRAQHGQYPVIAVSFDSANGTTFDALLKQLASSIGTEYARHAYLLSGDTLSESEKDFFQRITENRASYIELCCSLERLIHFLYRYHNKHVMVLLDGCDLPRTSGLKHGFYQTMGEFMRTFLVATFKDTPGLAQGILSGTLPLLEAEIFGGFHNVSIYSATDERYQERFGFTKDETGQLLDYYAISNLDTIEQWYNGYVFGKTESMFNPWSVLNCIKHSGTLETYWANTHDTILLKRPIAQATSSTKRDFELLLAGGSLEKPIEESIVLQEFDRSDNLIWSLLLFTGYLTYQHITHVKGQQVAQLTFPNKEIAYLFDKLIK